MNVSNKKIIWLASYPKSGNTYLRCMLGYYLYGNSLKFSFEYLKKIPKFESEYVFKNTLNKKILDKNFHYYKHFINVQKKLIKKHVQQELIFKTHHFFGELNNFKFTNEDTTHMFIYVIRDPREILVSYAKYKNISIDEFINTFISKKILLWDNKMETAVSWDLHYRSWKSFNKVEGLFVKFEDLVLNPKKILTKILIFLSKRININLDANLIEKTIKLTKFNNLKKLENKLGFQEGEHAGVNNFFRAGKINSWKEILTNKQVEKIENAFYNEMIEMKYI